MKDKIKNDIPLKITIEYIESIVNKKNKEWFNVFQIIKKIITNEYFSVNIDYSNKENNFYYNNDNKIKLLDDFVEFINDVKDDITDTYICLKIYQKTPVIKNNKNLIRFSAFVANCKNMVEIKKQDIFEHIDIFKSDYEKDQILFITNQEMFKILN